MLRSLIGTIVVYICLRLFVFDIYFIHSSSMRSTLQEGDHVLVNKFFLNKPERFDLLVFSPPVKDSAYGNIDSYIKRCAGIPGDTIQVSRGELMVNGVNVDVPGVQYHFHVLTSEKGLTDSTFSSMNIQPAGRVPGSRGFSCFLTMEQADRLRMNEQILSVEMTTDDVGWYDPQVFPYSERLKWNLDHWGPIMVPGEGMNIPLNEINFIIYKGTITLFEHHTLDIIDGKYHLDGKETDNYTFENDYYIVMGDNRHASSDSRSWGFVPAANIRGTAGTILWSTDPVSDTSRPERRLTRIH